MAATTGASSVVSKMVDVSLPFFDLIASFDSFKSALEELVPSLPKIEMIRYNEINYSLLSPCTLDSIRILSYSKYE